MSIMEVRVTVSRDYDFTSGYRKFGPLRYGRRPLLWQAISDLAIDAKNLPFSRRSHPTGKP